MIVVVFRAHRTEVGLGDEYAGALKRMEELAVAMPGYVSHKAYVAPDGERLTLFEWESAETLRTWETHPDHLLTKRLGRDRFYEGLLPAGLRSRARVSLFPRSQRRVLKARLLLDARDDSLLPREVRLISERRLR